MGKTLGVCGLERGEFKPVWTYHVFTDVNTLGKEFTTLQIARATVFCSNAGPPTSVKWASPGDKRELLCCLRLKYSNANWRLKGERMKSNSPWMFLAPCKIWRAQRGSSIVHSETNMRFCPLLYMIFPIVYSLRWHLGLKISLHLAASLHTRPF